MAFPWLHKVTWTLSVRLLHMDTGRVGTSLVAYFKWLFLAWESGLSRWVKILHEQLAMSPTGQRCKAFCWHVNLTSWWYNLLFNIWLKKVEGNSPRRVAMWCLFNGSWCDGRKECQSHSFWISCWRIPEVWGGLCLYCCSLRCCGAEFLHLCLL